MVVITLSLGLELSFEYGMLLIDPEYIPKLATNQVCLFSWIVLTVLCSVERQFLFKCGAAKIYGLGLGFLNLSSQTFFG